MTTMATMTTREAGQALGIGGSGVRMLVQRGDLHPVRRGARPLRFNQAEVWRLQSARRSVTERAAIQALHAEADAVLASQVSGV